MKIPEKKWFGYVWNIDYPVKDGSVQKDIDDTDRASFARLASKKAVSLCLARIEKLLANDLDNFDLDQELSDLHETLSFAKHNFYM